ncbi:MAG TPA: GGDEF domain-containing protein [Acidiferrobacterales bacterium]
MNDRRRAADRRERDERRRRRRDHAARGLAGVSWDEQRAQFLTRYLFWALGLAYFNIGEPTARSAEYLVAANVMHGVYFCFTTAYLIHAWRNTLSPLRLRLAMWTDLTAASFVVLADANVMSPAYLVYLVIILGNGMRYGLPRFAEAAAGSFLLGVLVLGMRFTDYMNALSVASVFFILFCGIIVVYSYSLMANVDRARRQLEIKSSVDILTGLLNRRGLYERAEDLFDEVDRSQRPMAILFADLDGFKAVNDAHGHHAGDNVLKSIGRMIGACIRDEDVAARFGGDEFVILLPDTTLEQATAVAQRLQAALADSRVGEFDLSVSIGMGEAPGHGRDLNSVLERVDSAMYRCKLSFGKGGIQRADAAVAT